MLSDEPKSFSRSLKATQVITVSCKDIVQVSSPTSLPGSLQEWGEANLELLACVETAKKKVLLMFPSVEKKSEWMSALEALRLGKRLRVKEHNGDVSKESLNSTSTETEEPEKTDDGRTLATPPHTPVTTGLATSPPGPKPAEPMRVEKELAVVIVGKTGNGKSATANSLLGERLFESSLGGSSVTAKCQSHEVQYEEKNITVIDTPGMFDTTRNEEEVEKEIEQCIELASAGISAILVVINPMTRFTQEEASSIMGLEKVFGKRLMDHMGIVFTHGDGVTIDDLKHYLDTAPKNLQDLLVRMGFGERSRAVLVDNSSSFPSKVGLQQKLLVNLVGNILERNEGKVYERSDLETAHEEAKQARAAEEKAKADEREKQESELRKAIEGQYQLRLELAKNEIRDDIRRELDEKDAEQREHLKNELTTKLAAAKESIQIEAKATFATPSFTAAPAANSATALFVAAVRTLRRAQHFDEDVATCVQKKILGNKEDRFTAGEQDAASLFSRLVDALREAFITEDSAFTSVFTLDDATVAVRVEATMLLYSALELLADPSSPTAD
ncbi:hypothetical protein CYMTET_28689 [Cymbomonas tetramitiformis]|uniref:AIG1-type G domain-containing protein n=1 Tax=Cymbomonas tetramitiformis TaxID=36881 RepID=A0AAE0KVX8_9CHLO|nr:hypothetical protein CYMTET_28689 [Cymbomonas tetramitiformis]